MQNSIRDETQQAVKTIFTKVFLTIIPLFAAHLAASAANFQNLGFESASLVPIPADPYNRVQFGPAFPGWTGYVGGVQQTAALYNNEFLDTSGIGIIDHGWPYPY